MNPKELRHRLNQFPRQTAFALPSPLQRMKQLEQKLNGADGPQLWIKRDDLLGPALGGNKGRKLIYLMGEALHLKKRKVATYGGLQSNSARMTAAACAALGLEAHLFYFERKPAQLTGNLLLNQLLGAKMHFIPYGSGENNMTLETTNRLVRILAALRVGPSAYFIPNGGHNLTGCLGYVDGACEIHEQALALGLPLEKITVITATGTGGTLAGLLAGFALLGSPIRVLGIDIAKLYKGFAAGIGKTVTDLTTLLGQPRSFAVAEVPIIEKTYVGQGYAQPTAEGLRAIRLLAEAEAILLDPVYTGKTMAGLLDQVRTGRFSPDDILIFLHTGGTPGLWAYQETLSRYLDGGRGSG